MIEIPVPAPRAWQRTAPTDAPVLRNDLWDAMRSIPRGVWSVAVYSGTSAPKLVAIQDYAVDDFGSLAVLAPAASQANDAWHASGYTIDQAACEWMDQFTAPLPPGSALQAMASQARQPQTIARADDPTGAHVLPAPRSHWYAASVQVADDLQWQPGQPLISVEIEHDELQRLVLTGRQARALGALLLSLALTACGGGGDDPDVGTPRVDCRVEVCR